MPETDASFDRLCEDDERVSIDVLMLSIRAPTAWEASGRVEVPAGGGPVYNFLSTLFGLTAGRPVAPYGGPQVATRVDGPREPVRPAGLGSKLERRNGPHMHVEYLSRGVCGAGNWYCR